MLKKVMVLCLSSGFLMAQPLEKKYLSNQTYGYDDLMTAYEVLDNRSDLVNVHQFGSTDAGEPLTVVEVHRGQSFVKANETEKLKILVLNGIHAGESDGIDACLHWVEELIENPEILEHVSIYIIAVYNVGGYQNQGCCTRADQNGPSPLGFRGNANNLDLNRDFMKSDARNTKSFQELFHWIKPDLLFDTHTTNGADYQYVMTLLPGPFERFTEKNRTFLDTWLDIVFKVNNDVIQTGPYVNVWGKTPEAGFAAFRQNANFSGGYAALFGVPAITLETHMFKPYAERVEATITTLKTITNQACSVKKQLKEISWSNQCSLTHYPISWKIDSSAAEIIDFEGYEAEYYVSLLTGQKTYRYNRNKPKTFNVTFLNRYEPSDSVRIPRFYFFHAGQHKVLSELTRNGTQLKKLEKDTLMSCTVHYVKSLKSATQPYEGHFQHHYFTLEVREIRELFLAGDYILKIDESAMPYVFESLEPQCEGSFFRWNYFDSYLQQKEGFSPYIFEEKAIAFLADNPSIKKEFEKKRAEDPAFAANHFAQMDWIYKRSPYYEKEHMRIPVFRVF